MKINMLLPIDLNIDIKGITDDSRLVKKNYIFVATKGFNVDHYDYIDDAINNGCSFIVCDRELDRDFPHMIVNDTHSCYIELCKKYYNINLSNFKFIGVTGTDGKTTTTTILKELIGDAAYLGTNGLEVGNMYYNTHNTTPCINELYHDFSLVKKNNCNTICMEVSSEALLHNRVDQIEYEIIGFTNITGDHINIHGSFDNYVESKMKLINHLKDNGYIVLNGDDNILKQIKGKNIISFGFNDNNDYVIKSVVRKYKFEHIELFHSNKTIMISSPFYGKYNVYNVVMAFIMAKIYGIGEKIIISRIKELSPIKGRCEFLDFGQKFDIVLDYAHTINGIISIISSFKDYENIIVVTGCAGGRDHDKRSIIGKYIIDNCNIPIFTMDDPRYEDVDDIIDEMVGDSKDYFRIVDREDAINYALNIAYPGSVVLILGKGRDNYMAIKDKKIHYSDYEVIYNYYNKE